MAFRALPADIEVLAGMHLYRLGSSVTLLNKTTPDWAGVSATTIDNEVIAVVLKNIRFITTRAYSLFVLLFVEGKFSFENLNECVRYQHHH